MYIQRKEKKRLKSNFRYLGYWNERLIYLRMTVNYRDQLNFVFSSYFYVKHERKVPGEAIDRARGRHHKNLENSNKLTGNPNNTTRFAAEYRFSPWIRGYMRVNNIWRLALMEIKWSALTFDRPSTLFSWFSWIQASHRCL